MNLFWEDLTGLYGLCKSNWCVRGDFNVMRFPLESSGGREKRSMKDFNSFVREIRLKVSLCTSESFT